MNRTLFYKYIVAGSLIIMSVSCSVHYKSASFYEENKTVINALRATYDSLYKNKTFSGGFTDKTCKYYVMQITTDSLRSIYNTEKTKNELWKNIHELHYDTTKLKEMSSRMKSIKCLWIGKAIYYFGDNVQQYTYISFRSVDRIFLEDRYYTLLFLEHIIYEKEIEEYVKKGRLYKLDSLTYFTIANKYR